MRSTRARTGVLVAAAILAAAAPAALAVPAGAATTTPPVITAHPDDVMVNATTKLVGAGFAAHATVHIAECGATSWVVPNSPCDTSNTVTVRTNGKGKFKVTFTVQACDATSTTGPGDLSMRCYIGVPTPTGIDTVELQPFTPIVVTYP
jgi:hypothetical protein